MKYEKQISSLSFFAFIIAICFSLSQNGIHLSGLTESINPFYNSAEASQQVSENETTTSSKNDKKLFLVGEGKASYYADEFHGRRTANGETFNMHKLTAAHPSLPFGTWVRVTNMRNGKDVVVRINDRGPFAKGRIIDLSIDAAKEIGIMQSGTVRVKLEALRSEPSV
ncbi:MAG: septal ring lytic transglycosylase RlpA family protein [Chlorobiaceae bacterium]